MNPDSKLLLLPQPSRYALSAVAFLASGEPDRLHMVQEIAERIRVSSSYLAKILQNLANKGIVESRRGTHGGYRLVKRPGALTMAEVVRASHPHGDETAQCMIEARDCGGGSPCALHRLVSRSERDWWARLEKTTIAKISRRQALFLAETNSRTLENR